MKQLNYCLIVKIKLEFGCAEPLAPYLAPNNTHTQSQKQTDTQTNTWSLQFIGSTGQDAILVQMKKRHKLFFEKGKYCPIPKELHLKYSSCALVLFRLLVLDSPRQAFISKNNLEV